MIPITLLLLFAFAAFVSADVNCCVGTLCVNAQEDVLDLQLMKYLCGSDVENCSPVCKPLEIPSTFTGPCTTEGDQEGLPFCEFDLEAELGSELGSLGCVSRKTMLARGKSWVDKKIPYSQKKTYQGYRTDCSGFVSMCWGEKKPGYTTRTINQVSHTISKGSLQAGDALLNAGSHVVLFVKWANSAKTKYVSYEESGSKGSVARVTPYPYWSGSYHPIRYNKAC
ncbi:hypothetical protein GEMRC1_008259 [Eukaryota sp. GEM-RC1]